MSTTFNFDIQLIFAILNGKIWEAIKKRLFYNFKQNNLDITTEQWTALLYLSENEGATQLELCKAIYKDKPSMTRLINSMEQAGLVLRATDKSDRRMNYIYLTQSGKEIGEKAMYVANMTLKETLRGLTMEELRVSQKVLRKIFNNTNK